MNLNSLTEIIDVKVLQEIQDKFAAATGLGVVIADKDGNSLTNPSCFSKLCQIIWAATKGLETGETMMAPCHAGLYDLAAPIVVNGTYLGSVLCGQVLVNEPDEQWKRNLALYLYELNINVDDECFMDFSGMELIANDPIRTAHTIMVHTIFPEEVREKM